MAPPPRVAKDTEVMGLSCGLIEVDVHTKQWTFYLQDTWCVYVEETRSTSARTVFVLREIKGP